MTDHVISPSHPLSNTNFDELPNIPPIQKPSPKGLGSVPDRLVSANANPTWDILNANRTNEQRSKEFIASCGLEVIATQKETTKLKKQQTELLREKADKLSKADYWSDLSSVLSYVRDVSSLALTIGAGGTVEPFVIAAAGLNLSKPLIDLCGGWDYMASFLTEDKNNQKWLSDTLQTTVGYASLAASLLSSRNIVNDSQMPKKVEKIFKSATNLFQGLTLAMSGLHRSSLNKAQRILEKITNFEESNQEVVVNLSSEISKTEEAEQETHKIVKNLILTQSRI